MDIVPTECCWPDCSAPPSEIIQLPVCDRHIVKTYRAVAEHGSSLDLRDVAVPTGRPARRARPASRSDAVGVVYFARDGHLIKIGFTTNLRQRMRRLRPEEVLAVMPGTKSIERALHFKFGHLWDAGEWFRMGDDLMNHINEVRDTHGEPIQLAS